ncbi:MAG: hypothetical protein ABEJ98_02715 [Candidatus Nanohaloarchaea archaeon]
MSTFTADRISAATAVPRKGRNAREAMEAVLEESYFSCEVISGMINGKGKEAAKNGDTTGIRRELEQPGWQGVKLAETGRDGERPTLDRIETLDGAVEGYALEEDPFGDYSEVWMPYDQAAELALREGEGSALPDLEATAKDYAEGYEVVEERGSTITWAAMNSELEKEPEVVLVPEKFQRLGKELAEEYWEGGYEIDTFSGNVDEERELAQTSGEVAGIYMYDSGETAEGFGLDYEQVGEAESRLARFQNRFKDNAENLGQEAY